MPLLYIARQKSNSKKNCAICNFDRALPLNCANLAFYALGKFGVAQTGIRFKGGVRRQENFESAGVLQFDIDLKDRASSLSSPLWRDRMGKVLDPFPYKAFAYASQHKGAHVFVELDGEIGDLPRYLRATRKAIAYLSSFLDSSFAYVDPAVKDGARMFFEGLECADPENWVYENGGKPLNPDEIPDAPSPLSASEAAPILDLVTEGSRNCSAYKIAHKCMELAAGDVSKAEKIYRVMIEGSTLPARELESCFESAQRKRETRGGAAKGGSPFKNRGSSRAQAYEEISEKLRREFRKDRNVLEGEAGSLYILRPLEGKNCGTALRCSKEAYLDRRTDLCRNPGYSPELKQSLLKSSSAVFPAHILSDEGLVKRKPGKAILKNGSFSSDSGFSPLREGEYLVDPLAFEYVEEECSGPFRKFLDSVLPKDPNSGVSPEQMILGDFVRSSILEGGKNEQFLICVGNGSNGKSTLAEILSNTLGQDRVALPGKELLSRDKPRFALGQAREGYLGIMHELGNGRPLSNEGAKNFISRDRKSSDVKNAREAARFAIPYCTMALANRLPVFEDMSDEGLTRKLRVIEFSRRFDGSKKINVSDPAMLEDCARWICQCLRSKPIKDFVWKEYPARKEWIENENDRGVLGELLKPSKGRRVVKISQIMIILSKTHNPLAKLGYKRLIRLMESWGYEVCRTTHGCEIKGYEIDAASPLYKCANGEPIPASYEEEAGGDWEESCAESRKGSYMEEILRETSENPLRERKAAGKAGDFDSKRFKGSPRQSFGAANGRDFAFLKENGISAPLLTPPASAPGKRENPLARPDGVPILSKRRKNGKGGGAAEALGEISKSGGAVEAERFTVAPFSKTAAEAGFSNA